MCLCNFSAAYIIKGLTGNWDNKKLFLKIFFQIAKKILTFALRFNIYFKVRTQHGIS